MNRSPHSAWMFALSAGLTWGLVPPSFLGALVAVIGAGFAGRSLTGALIGDIGRGAMIGALWAAILLHWLPGVASEMGLPELVQAWWLLIALQAVVSGLAWGAASMAMKRGVRPELALALVWGALSEPIASLLPLPLVPGMLAAGTTVALAPSGWGGLSLQSFVIVYAGAGMPRPSSAVVLGATFLLGGLRLNGPHTDPNLTVGIALSDVGSFEGARPSTEPSRARRLLAQVHALPEADLVVTAEAAWPYDAGRTGSQSRAQLERAWSDAPPTVVGAPLGSTNAVIAVEEGRVVGTFAKQILVPVAETPWRGRGRTLYAPGTGPRLLDLAGVRVAPLICYEDLFPAALRQAHREGVRLLVSSTTDVHLRNGPGAAWHFALSRLAASSTGRPLVRATHGGWPAVFSSTGRVIWTAPYVDGDASPKGRHALVRVITTSPPFCGAQVSPWLGAFALGVWMWLLMRPPEQV